MNSDSCVKHDWRRGNRGVQPGRNRDEDQSGPVGGHWHPKKGAKCDNPTQRNHAQADGFRYPWVVGEWCGGQMFRCGDYIVDRPVLSSDAKVGVIQSTTNWAQPRGKVVNESLITRCGPWPSPVYRRQMFIRVVTGVRLLDRSARRPCTESCRPSGPSLTNNQSSRGLLY